MQAAIPVPTDNLYKFAALFGLVLIIASIAGFVVVYNNAYAELIQIADRYLILEGKDDAASKEMKGLLNKRIDIVTSNRSFYIGVLALPFVIGGALSWWGFGRWAKIQPLHDELLELQVTKARKEVHGDLNYSPFQSAPLPKPNRKLRKGRTQAAATPDTDTQ